MNPAYENYSYRPHIQLSISIVWKPLQKKCGFVFCHVAAILILSLLIMTVTFMLTYSEGTEKSATDLSDFYNIKELLVLAFNVWKEAKD